MKIKSYFSRTVEDAMAMAGQELGPDAVLLNSRKSAPESRHLGEYEVVFADTVPAEAQAETAGGAPVPERQPVPDRLSQEVAELKGELENMRRAITRSAFAPPHWARSSADASNAYAALTAADVAPDLAREIVEGAEARTAPAPITGKRGAQRRESHTFARALAAEMESRVQTQSTLGVAEARPAIVALVGPAGSGKTSTLVKLAVNYGLAARRPSLLLSTDTYRVAAAEQLRCYAAILGVAFQVHETVAALAQAIEENRGKELILIDTPGLSYGDLPAAAQMAEFLASRKDIDTHLVLPASMRAPDLARASDAFGVFRPRRLLFTKLDETGSFGPILNETIRTGRPLSFFSDGQRIPEDLETAGGSRLVSLILAGYSGQAVSAA